MADILDNRINRRQFLKTTLAAAGSVTLLSSCRSWQRSSCAQTPARWAWVSDTHVPADPENNYRGFYPYQNLEKVAAQIAGDLPEGVVITGDLARLQGLEGDYANARKLLAPITEQRPVCVALGNHDDRKNFVGAFEGALGETQDVSGKHVVIAETGPVRFIVLDSLLFVNKVPGLLGQAQRTWLANYLQTSDNTPTILFFHHSLGDGDGDLLDLPRLFDLIEPVRKVKAVVYGHSHVHAYAEHDGIHLINLPATGYNFNDAQPVGWVDARLTAEGGTFTVRAVAGNTDVDGNTQSLAWRS